METQLGVQVLVADDEEALRESMRMLLEDAGYPVIEAADGRGTLDTLRFSPKPLVVLLDLVMPQHGQHVLDAIAADPTLATRHIYVVCTARVTSDGQLLPADARQVAQMLDLAGTRLRLVPKPFDIDDLLEAVDEAARDLLAIARPSEPQSNLDSLD